jgi:hypothetical protein
MGKMVDIEKVKDWLYDNFFDITNDSDYGDYTTLEATFDTFEEMMDDFNKKMEVCDCDDLTNMKELYNKVSDVLYGFKSYHCWYICTNEIYYDNSMEFEVHVHSDKGDGDDWVEYWSIDNEGKIYSEDTTYNTFEEFLREWE